MTEVINLFGGSGLGKSTTAYGLAYNMKMKGLHMELVTEYVKKLAWEGIKVGALDQPYIFGKQSKYESRLYNKVEYIVTDSPLLLSPMYERFWTGDSIVLPAVLKFLEASKKSGTVYHNFLLDRKKPFDGRGRYETEKQAKQVDKEVKNFLEEFNIPYTKVDCEDVDRVNFILTSLGVS